MNALTMLANQNAQSLAEAQSAIDTTAPVVNPNRPESNVESTLSTPNKRVVAGNTLYHLLFVGCFLFGGIMALGKLTGEIDVDLPKI